MRRQLTGLMLALTLGACHRDEPSVAGKPLSHWKKEATKVSLFTFWNSDKDERRNEAFRRLKDMGEDAVPALVDLLQHKSLAVSGDAFNVLTSLGPRAAGAVPQMIELLNADAPRLRLHAAWILGTIGPAAEPGVARLTLLLRSGDPTLRQAAAQALGRIGGAGHDALARARESNNSTLREASMRGIAARQLDAHERRTYVATGLRDPSPEVRLRAVDLLTAVQREEAESLATYLVKAINDPDVRVSGAAHGVFNVYLQHNGATAGLLAIVLTGGDVESRADAAWHLGHSPPSDEGVVAALEGALADSEPKVRLYAARALAQGEGRAQDEGLRALRREIPNVEPILAVRAARILWTASHDLDEVTRIYEAGLKDPKNWNRVETMSAIMDMGREAESFRSHFERLQSDPDPQVRDRAEKALYWLKVRR